MRRGRGELLISRTVVTGMVQVGSYSLNIEIA